MIAYAAVDEIVTQAQVRWLLDHRRPIATDGDIASASRVPETPVWFADIPSVGMLIRKGTPYCSIYLDLRQNWAAELRRLRISRIGLRPVSIRRLSEQIQGDLEKIGRIEP
jgi:hypothetical protein